MSAGCSVRVLIVTKYSFLDLIAVIAADCTDKKIATDIDFHYHRMSQYDLSVWTLNEVHWPQYLA